MATDLEGFYKRQLDAWSTVRQTYEMLDSVVSRRYVDVEGTIYTLLANTLRMRSTGADVSPAAVAERPCFLCRKNRPKEQISDDIDGLELLLNPYPVFNPHYVIASPEHCCQSIRGRIGQMARIAQAMWDYTIFYNGPRCGASAPDHLHFQAVRSSELPIWEIASGEGSVRRFGPEGFIFVESATPETLEVEVGQLLSRLPAEDGAEPMVNILARATVMGVECVIVPRRRHRPSFWGRADSVLISPGAIDVSGVTVISRRDDFDRVDASMLGDVMREVCYSPEEIMEMILQ